MKKYLALLLLPALFAFLAFPNVSEAAISSDATETTANVAASTIPSITLANGSAATFAGATLTLPTKANSANNDYIILSHTGVAATAVCFYFDTNASLSDDTGTAAACQAANGVAGGIEVDVSGATTAATVAALFHTAINAVVGPLTVTSTNNGDGTLTLTNDTPGTTGNVAVNAGYWAEAITHASGALTALSGGIASTSASTTIAISAGLVANAADHSITIDGVTIDLGTSVQTATQLATAIAAATYTGGTSYLATGAYTVAADTTNVIFTRTAVGVAGNGALALADNSYGRKAQVVVFAAYNVATGDAMTVTINGTPFSFTTPVPTLKSLIEGLHPLVDASPIVSCTEDDAAITCTAESAGTAFTYSVTTTVYTAPVVSGGGGSSGIPYSAPVAPLTPSMQCPPGHMFNVMTGSPCAGISVNASSTVQGNGQTNMGANVSAYARSLQMGDKGVDVKSLQAYLNAHGFPVAANGSGSKGKETNTFGPATKAALKKFQASVGIPATGNFGPLTRNYINTH